MGRSLGCIDLELFRCNPPLVLHTSTQLPLCVAQFTGRSLGCIDLELFRCNPTFCFTPRNCRSAALSSRAAASAASTSSSSAATPPPSASHLHATAALRRTVHGPQPRLHRPGAVLPRDWSQASTRAGGGLARRSVTHSRLAALLGVRVPRGRLRSAECGEPGAGGGDMGAGARGAPRLQVLDNSIQDRSRAAARRGRMRGAWERVTWWPDPDGTNLCHAMPPGDSHLTYLVIPTDRVVCATSVHAAATHLKWCDHRKQKSCERARAVCVRETLVGQAQIWNPVAARRKP
eukprot:48340-Chlamydomonas_euryale.AAC.2